ncbi:MAG: glycosyltransferase family 2 protein [Treponema sp.]|nr:glycosyltransferase family 2 protein [Treponema sp.]
MQMFTAMVYAVMYIKKVKFSDIRLYKESYNMVPISILIPAYNEEKTVIHTIKSLLAIEYSTYEVIVVNDGSKDNTLKHVIRAFGLRKITFPMKAQIKTNPIRGIYFNPDHPNLLLVDKENGGKADALNAGINVSRYPYFVSLDADSVLDADALVRIALSFMEYKYTIAVGGIIRVANGSEVKNGKVVKLALPRSRLAMFQIVEYMRAFLVGRVGWSVMNTVLIVSGAFGAFQKETVIQVGGYTTDTVGEDMDIIVKLHKYMREKKYKYKITFLPDPICWTQVPEGLRDLYTQRRRWHVGLIDTMKRNKIMMLNPRYGVSGLLAMPYFYLFEMIAPVVEALGIVFVPLSYFLGILSVQFFILFFIATTIFGVILSIGALTIEEFTFNKYVKLKEFLRLCLYGVIENFSYRQMTVVFRLIAIVRFKKYKNSWEKIKRKGFDEDKQKQAAKS